MAYKFSKLYLDFSTVKLVTITIVILLIIIMAIPSNMFSTSLTEEEFESNSKYFYRELLELRLEKLSKKYEINGSLPSYETYLEVLNGTYSDCYVYSWFLLIECEYKIFLWNISQLGDKFGGNETASLLIDNITRTYNIIKESLYNNSPKTIASIEWISLAKDDIISGGKYLSWAKEAFAKEDYNSSLAYLAYVYSYLLKSEDELKIAFERNSEPASTHEQSKIEHAMEKLSSKLINDVNNSVKDTTGVKRLDLVNYSRSVLSMAKWYYDNESHYFALMYAAEAKATLKYAYFPVLTNRSEALKRAENFVKWAEKNLTKVYFNPNVDAPLAEYNFELAKLYLQDSSSEEEDFAAILLADAASQAALIAAEQAKQALRIVVEVESLENVENEGKGESLWEKISIWDLIAFIGGLIAIPVAIYLIFIKYGGKLRFRLGGRRK